MKRLSISILFLGALLILLTGNVAAQFPDTLFLEFDFEGFGNLVLMSPPVYSGDITAGDSRLVGGTWWVQIDDTGWPPVSDPAVRWDYIFTNFFVYNSTYHFWTAVFDQNTLPAKPTWEIDHPTNGTMSGTLIVSSVMTDNDMDGILDVDERMFGTFEGDLMVMKYGTGNFAKYCGQGSYNGAFWNDDPGNWADDYVTGHCLLDLINCEIATVPKSWSAIKTIYR
jgi:hypothetical protein